MKLALLSILAGLLAGRAAFCIQQRPLDSRSERRVALALLKIEGKDKDEQRKEMLAVADLGASLERHLAALAARDTTSPVPLQAIDALHYLWGRDLIEKPMKASTSPYSRWTFGVGEILVLQGLSDWAGIRVAETYDPDKGTVSIEVVRTKDPILPLHGPGVERETIPVAGELAPAAAGRQTAFHPRLYRFRVLGGDVELLSVGTRGFRYRLGDSALPVFKTGKSNYREVKASMAGGRFESKPNEDWDANARRAQQYLYRLIDGLDPLPTYDTEDEARFASAEHIQTGVLSETTTVPVLYASFPHALEDPPYTPQIHALLLDFAKSAFNREDMEVVVSRGNQEMREANLYFDGKAFKRPADALRKRLRNLFPEDY